MAGLLLEGHAVVPQRLLAQASPVLLARLFLGILPHPATPEVPSGSLSFYFSVLAFLASLPSGSTGQGLRLCAISPLVPGEHGAWLHHAPQHCLLVLGAELQGQQPSAWCRRFLVAWCKPACMTAFVTAVCLPG